MKSLLPPTLLVATFALLCVATSSADPVSTTTSVQVQSGFAKVQGGQLYYEVAGAGDPVVFIHGNVGDRRHWDHQFQALANQFRVIRYDVRGFGRSSLPVEGQPYADYDDLAALLDDLGIKSAHIVGWSMGSGIAIDFAVAYPRRVRSLTSVGPWLSGYSSAAARAMSADMVKVGAALAQGGQAAAVTAWMDAPFFAGSIRDPAAGAEFRRIAADYSFWEFSHRSLSRELEPPALDRLSDIRVPTLILTAEHDIPVCLEVAALLDKSIPDSRKVIMAGTGHLLQMEKAQEFNKHLIDFLARLSRSR